RVAEAAHVAPASVHLDVDGVGGHALEDDAVAAEWRRVLRPLRRDLRTHARDVLEHDALFAVGDADESEPQASHRAGWEGTRGRVECHGGDPLLDRVVDPVEAEAEPGREAPHHWRP